MNILDRLGSFNPTKFDECNDNDELIKILNELYDIAVDVANWNVEVNNEGGEAKGVFIATLPVVTMNLENAYNKGIETAKRLNPSNQSIQAEKSIKVTGDLIIRFKVHESIEAIIKLLGGSLNSDCYIATATIGDSNHPDLLILRKFRDTYLMQTTFGKLFVTAYYYISPSLANFIRNRSVYRTLSKFLIVNPLIKIARKLINNSK